jgi:hypothetical protein
VDDDELPVDDDELPVEDDELPVEDDEPPPPHPLNRKVHNTNNGANARNDRYMTTAFTYFLFNQYSSHFTAAHH